MRKLNKASSTIFRQIVLGVILSTISFLLFLKILAEVLTKDILFVDAIVLNFIYSFRDPFLTEIMHFVSFLGGEFTLLSTTIIVIFLAFKKYKKEAALFAFIILSGYVFNNVLKQLLKIPRPDIDPIAISGFYSFPSGHAMNSFIFYGLLAYFTFHFTRNRGVRVLVLILSMALILLIGFSRLYLGLHYLSDVIGGFILGFWWLTTAILIDKTCTFYKRAFFVGKRTFVAISIVIIFGLIFLSFLNMKPHERTKSDVAGAQSNKQQATLVKAIDGDTITVSINGKNEVVRIIGIDTPEVVDTRKTVGCFGKEASDFAKLALQDNKTLFLESDPTQGNRDKYQRLLRYVWIDDWRIDFGKLMITEGYASEYTYNLPYKYQDEYKQAEEEAQEAKRGLWAEDACGSQTAPTSHQQQSATNVSGRDKDCLDFATHEEAQTYFESKGGSATNNVDRLDSDHDGIACESLP